MLTLLLYHKIKYDCLTAEYVCINRMDHIESQRSLIMRTPDLPDIFSLFFFSFFFCLSGKRGGVRNCRWLWMKSIVVSSKDLIYGLATSKKFIWSWSFFILAWCYQFLVRLFPILRNYWNAHKRINRTLRTLLRWSGLWNNSIRLIISLLFSIFGISPYRFSGPYRNILLMTCSWASWLYGFNIMF